MRITQGDLYPPKALNYLFRYKHSFVPDELRAPGVPPFRNCSIHTRSVSHEQVCGKLPPEGKLFWNKQSDYQEDHRK